MYLHVFDCIRCCSTVAALLQSCCSAVAALLQRCCTNVARLLQRCCIAVNGTQNVAATLILYEKNNF
jgi:hypothetical protein